VQAVEGVVRGDADLAVDAAFAVVEDEFERHVGGRWG
jgi:hypothetical protein